MKKILTAFLLFIVITPTIGAETSLNTITGVILGPDQEPVVGASIIPVGIKAELKTNADIADANGKFVMTNFPKDTNAQIASIGYETLIVPASDLKQDMTIHLKLQYEVLSGAAVTPCTLQELQQQDPNAKDGMWIPEDTNKNEKAYCKLNRCNDGYLLENATGEYIPNAKCTPCTQKIPGSKTAIVQNNKCVATSCKCGYDNDNGICKKWDDNKPCTANTLPKLPQGAQSAEMKCDGEQPYCKIIDCINVSYKRSNDNRKCENQEGKSCTPTDANADTKGAKYEFKVNANKLVCKPVSCKPERFVVKPDGDDYKCIRDDKACTKTEIAQYITDKHATAGQIQQDLNGNITGCIISDCESGFSPALDGKSCKSMTCDCKKEWDDEKRDCVDWKDLNCTAPHATKATKECENEKTICKINECDTGYRLDADKNVCVFERGVECAIDGDPNVLAYLTPDKNGKLECKAVACKDGHYEFKNGKCEPRDIMSDEDIDKLKDNAQKMRDKEQSTENKMLGAVGIGTVGIGGMMAASALSEKAADASAEAAMGAYLETFRCDYGSGKNHRGGETEIELPGGNDMFNLYAQYATLSNDLKARKTALGIKPGIESEIVIDKAETGLYDDVGTGITGGQYASVARAIVDPNGEDAKKWAAQKEQTAQNLKTGAIVAGAGAVASLAGNIALNSGDAKKNKVNDILSNATYYKYKPLEDALDKGEQIINATPPEPKSCPDFAPGEWPDCRCTNQQFNVNTATCEDCTHGEVFDETTGACKCPTDKTWRNANGDCTAEPQKCQEQCGTDPLVTWDQNCSCSCKNGYTYALDTKSCTCATDNNFYIDDNQYCTKKETVVRQTETFNKTIKLNSGALFKLGKSELLSDAQTNLKTAFEEFEKELQNTDVTGCTIQINGYTDPVGSQQTNDKLSKARAEAVQKYLKDNVIHSSEKIEMSTRGYGEDGCFCDTSNTLEKSDVKCKDGEHLHGDVRYSPCRRVEVVVNCSSTSSNTTITTK